MAIRRGKQNDFLTVCDKPILTVQKKPWSQLTSSKAKSQYIGTAANVIASTLEIISPEDSGSLREARLKSSDVEQTFLSHERHVIPRGNWVEDGVRGAKIKVKLPREHGRRFCSLQ